MTRAFPSFNVLGGVTPEMPGRFWRRPSPGLHKDAFLSVIFELLRPFCPVFGLRLRENVVLLEILPL
jgi:hypothetical protein